MKKIIGTCYADDCELPIASLGLCNKHYMRQYKHGHFKETRSGKKRNHPAYSAWFERKQSNGLCEQWLDFDIFCKDIGQKPEGNFRLLKLNGSELYGPDNFAWVEHLKRKEGESKSDWWARKWKTRQLANPSMENDRSLRRKYNLTLEDYNKKLTSQNFVCMICEKPETSYGATGGRKKLAVDHCHVTNKIRDLLCWRCNAMIGKVNESVELLQKMIDYLNKHKENTNV